MKAGLEITRRIPEKKAILRTSCTPGLISVLTDEAADGILHSYQLALSGRESDNRFSFSLNGSPFNPSSQETIGSGEMLPEHMNISEFLSDSGFSSAEIPKTIEQYDLEQYSYLNCRALNATATRQLQLLRALRSQSQVLICNDPFLPFNGRWREDFARLFLEAVQSSQRIILVTNLSFMPQTWARAEGIKLIDVGKAAERARKHAEEMAAKKAQEEARLAKTMLEEVTRAATRNVADSAQQKNPEHELETGLPENFQFGYKVVNDFLFAPLARISNAFRTYSGFAMPASVLGVGLLLAFIMYPNMHGAREKMAGLERDINWSAAGSEVVKRISGIFGSANSQETAAQNGQRSNSAGDVAQLAEDLDDLVPIKLQFAEQIFPTPDRIIEKPELQALAAFIEKIDGDQECALQSSSECQAETGILQCNS